MKLIETSEWLSEVTLALFHILGQWLLWQLTKVSNLSEIFSSQGREAQALCLLGPRALGITSHGVSIRQSGLLAAHLCNQPG